MVRVMSRPYCMDHSRYVDEVSRVVARELTGRVLKGRFLLWPHNIPHTRDPSHSPHGSG